MPRTMGSKNNTKYKYQLVDEVNKTKKLYKTMTEIAAEYDINVLSVHRLFNRVTKQGIFKNIKAIKSKKIWSANSTVFFSYFL